MKKFVSISLVLAMVLLCFSGCALTIIPSDEIHTDYEGVYISISEIDNSGDAPVLVVTWHNDTDETVCFGVGYTIEYFDGGEWKNIQIADFAVIEIACILEPRESGEQRYSTKYFNMLREGKYRIRTEFYVQGDEPKSGTTWAEFEQVKPKK